MSIYKIADLYIEINPVTDYTKDQLKDYMYTDGDVEPDFSVKLTKQHIIDEQELVPGLQVPLYESIAIYRYICLKILEKYNGIFFHCSALAIDNKAYLFTAPSGTGKSTHARMWREAFGDKVTMINDDKPIIREIDGKFYVYGTPWDGKHSLSSNVRVPLHAICLLNRGTENHIEKVSGIDNLSSILNQTIVPKQRNMMSNLLDILEKMLVTVNFFKMECTISTQSAIMAYEYMKKY